MLNVETLEVFMTDLANETRIMMIHPEGGRERKEAKIKEKENRRRKTIG